MKPHSLDTTCTLYPVASGETGLKSNNATRFYNGYALAITFLAQCTEGENQEAKKRCARPCVRVCTGTRKHSEHDW